MEMTMSDVSGKTVLAEFIEKWIRIENEVKLLAEDRKELVSDYKDKLDVKAVQAALRIVKMKARLDVSDEELENIVSALERHVSL
tara:strand:+ start:390 stop:644 length:255 start_codon:yes stop_codon:yes gene_type:complete